jgi:hypothetical protein
MGVTWSVAKWRRPYAGMAMLEPAMEPHASAPALLSPDDEEALHELTLFVTDFVIPLGHAKIDLQTAIIRNSYVNDALASLVIHSIVSNPNVREFGEHFDYLSDKFAGSPMELVPLHELKKRVLAMDKNYKRLMDQAYRLAEGAGWDVRTHKALAPLWETQRSCHNALVDAYRKIKRDRRFAPELYRPGIDGPWTQGIPQG